MPITYHGHVVPARDPKKTAAIRDWPPSITVADVRSFFGFTNYYRRFFKDFTYITCPLYALISRDNASKKNKAEVWTQGCQQAFDKLKDCCTSAPILAYADASKPFKLHTNVSGQGLGTVLIRKWMDRIESSVMKVGLCNRVNPDMRFIIWSFWP